MLILLAPMHKLQDHVSLDANMVSRSFYSNNWAGYIIAPYTYSQYNQVWFINGTFNVPNVGHSSTSPTEQTVVWIGIDGYNKNFTNTNLIQTGIGAISNSTGTFYYAWYELLPANQTLISMSIKPNDTVYTQITLINASSSIWNIYLKDLANDAVFSKNVSYYTPMQTAEWIVESPMYSSNGTIATLAPFSTVQFSNAYLYVVGKTHQNVTAIGQKYRPKTPVLINYTGSVQTYTSLIAADNRSFSVYYEGVPATTSTISIISSTISTIQSTTTIPQSVSSTQASTIPLSTQQSTSISQSSTVTQSTPIPKSTTTLQNLTTIGNTTKQNSSNIISAFVNGLINFFKSLFGIK